MRRPQTLREVAADTFSGAKRFDLAAAEFLDDFYLSHPDKLRQQWRIDEAPDFIGDPFADAWLGAVGEHLALRWALQVPDWTRRPQHFALEEPVFKPDLQALRSTLLAESPEAFRSRNIYTVAEPLQRARFPREKIPQNVRSTEG
jgi:hypothetical protein